MQVTRRDFLAVAGLLGVAGVATACGDWFVDDAGVDGVEGGGHKWLDAAGVPGRGREPEWSAPSAPARPAQWLVMSSPMRTT